MRDSGRKSPQLRHSVPHTKSNAIGPKPLSCANPVLGLAAAAAAAALVEHVTPDATEDREREKGEERGRERVLEKRDGQWMERPGGRVVDECRVEGQGLTPQRLSSMDRRHLSCHSGGPMRQGMVLSKLRWPPTPAQGPGERAVVIGGGRCQEELVVGAMTKLLVVAVPALSLLWESQERK